MRAREWRERGREGEKSSETGREGKRETGRDNKVIG